MFVSDLFDKAELEAHIADGYVSVRAHDEYPLSVLNYTSRAAFDYRWNHVTKTCRGLVIDHETDRVVARPFPKFFGVSEYAADELDAMGSFEIFDKLDGSLGVLVQGYGGPLIATRGVFHGPQAEHATALLSDRYADVRFPAGVTAMFEIVYPQNRIIVDYGEMDDLVYLGAVGLDRPTGRSRRARSPLRLWSCDHEDQDQAGRLRQPAPSTLQHLAKGTSPGLPRRSWERHQICCRSSRTDPARVPHHASGPHGFHR
ncbi:MAG: hypothetical protein GY708_01475 [Actinomycetia bacterium]|nr:hypothetical protein [Actinomycetes bacterium]